MDENDTKRVSKIMIIKRDRVLILKSKHLHKYHLPGGHIKEYESFRSGLEREVKEETGLKIAKCGIYRKSPNFCLYKGWAYAGSVKLSDEHTDYAWADIKTVHSKYPLCNFTKRDLISLRNEFLKKEKRKNELDLQEEDV